jgi:RNA polymerase sigma factor (TIGR02999 family)
LLVGRARHDPDDSREAHSLPECGAWRDAVVGHMYLGAQQPSFDDGAVEHGLLRLVILLPLDMRDERVRRVLTDDLIPSLELNNVAVVERIATENRPGKGARDIAPGDTCQRRKGGYPLREGDFDIGRAAVGLRLRASRTSDTRGCGWRNGLTAARRREDTEAEDYLSHRATPIQRGTGNGPVRYQAQTSAVFPHELMTDPVRVHDVTGLLLSWRQGDAAALDRMVPLVYDELRRVARRHLRGERPGHALQATALVHEVYLRLVDVDRMTLTSRSHFFGVAASLMRQILVDHARRQRADKRGGGVTMLSLDEVSPAAQATNVDVLALDEALEALSSADARQCRVVELRFFAGLTIDEAAEALGLSPATVEREWAFAKAWLLRHLSRRE